MSVVDLWGVLFFFFSSLHVEGVGSREGEFPLSPPLVRV